MSKRKRKNTIKQKSTNKGEINSNKQENTADEKPWSKSKKKRMRKLLGEKDENNCTTTRNTGDFTSHPNSTSRLKPKKKVSRSDANFNQSRSDDNPVSSNDKSAQESKFVRDEVKEDIVLMMGNKNKPRSALQQAFQARLAGSRFRELNEELYTTTSSSAHQRFKDNPELFDQYHQGFRTQVKSWPINPVDVILRWLIAHQKKRAGGKSSGTKRRKGAKLNTTGVFQLKVADFGCGDAMLGQKLLDYQKSGTKNQNCTTGATNEGQKIKSSKTIDTKTTPFSVHSFDLVSNGNPLITPCDMANVPLPDGTIDVGIFSLALMGTNIADFIREAHRVLTPGGILKIAEVRSRFETTSHIASSNDDPEGGRQRTFDQSLLQEFLRVMRELGFYCMEKDRSNRMFFLLEFKKTGAVPCRVATFTAKPCLYKRR